MNIFQQAMVGAFTGSVINGIAVLREIVFYHKEEKKWAKSKVWLIVFLLLMTAAPIVSWQGFISLLPAIGSSLVVVGFYCSNPKLLRIFGIIGQSFWVVYSCIILNLGGIIGSSLCILGGIIGFINDLKIQKIYYNRGNGIFTASRIYTKTCLRFGTFGRRNSNKTDRSDNI